MGQVVQRVQDVRHLLNNYLAKKPGLATLCIMVLACCSIVELVSKGIREL